MKTRILIISKYFPYYHINRGKETNFIRKMRLGNKIHTIRANYDYWKKVEEEVKKGDSFVSLRTWNGKPRHSKQVEIKKLYDINVEKLFFSNKNFRPYIVGEKKNKEICLNVLAINDGLRLPNFIEWFNHYDHNKPFVIIHFTNFKYEYNKEL